MGRPNLPVYRLEELSCSELILVPHVTTKGPNGLWIIRRGEKHPVVESSRDLGAYVLFDASKAYISTFIGADHWDSIKVFSIYRSRKLAQEKLEEERAYLDGEDLYDVNLGVRYCSGPDLLNLLAMVDEVEVDHKVYAITRDGRFFEKRNNELDVPLINADELKNVLMNANE
jgi:hypothetical protein